MTVQPVVDGSVWQLLQTDDLPEDSWCRSVANERQQAVWHAWNAQIRYCDFHKVNGMKAPVARVVAHRRSREAAYRPTRQPPRAKSARGAGTDTAESYVGVGRVGATGQNRCQPAPPASHPDAETPRAV